MEPLDERYFKWLCNLVSPGKYKSPSRAHWKLLRQMFTKEYVWLIANDDNRLADGLDLRHEFTEAEGIQDPSELWLGLGCSFLEMVIALSRRFAFEAEGLPQEKFWIMMRNLNLIEYTDRLYLPRHEETTRVVVDEILDRVIWRSYSRDGKGGLFPLRQAAEDQRSVELWYQLSAYVLERY